MGLWTLSSLRLLLRKSEWNISQRKDRKFAVNAKTFFFTQPVLEKLACLAPEKTIKRGRKRLKGCFEQLLIEQVLLHPFHWLKCRCSSFITLWAGSIQLFLLSCLIAFKLWLSCISSVHAGPRTSSILFWVVTVEQQPLHERQNYSVVSILDKDQADSIENCCENKMEEMM